MTTEESKPDSAGKPEKKGNVRQFVLVAVLLIVLAAFLYDRYYLWPEAKRKIDVVQNEISLATNAGNQKEIRDLFGFEPSKVFDYQGYEIEQYRFPRGLPFYRGWVMDIAFKDGAIAFYSTPEPMDEDSDLLKSKVPQVSNGRLSSENRDESELEEQVEGAPVE